MFAIIESGGKQYRVVPGAALSVERLETDPGSTVEFDRVLMIGDDDDVKVGNPLVDGARVLAHVVQQARSKKIIVFKYKAKSNYRRRTGHRQQVTRLRVAEILAPGARRAEEPPAVEQHAAPVRPARRRREAQPAPEENVGS